MNTAFSQCHPLVNLLYFLLVLGFAMVLMHPVCLAISLVCALIYARHLKGGEAFRLSLRLLLPLLLLTAALSPLFNHEGATILGYWLSGNPVTLESIVYGAAAATMLAAVISWFSCYIEVMTADKFIYLFGRVIPALSLTLSMALRMVPRLKEQLKEISDAQICLNGDLSGAGTYAKIRRGAMVFSILVTWTLENGVETANSMVCRGYGLPGRTAFFPYRLRTRDKKLLLFLAVTGMYLFVGGIGGSLSWRYFPTLGGNPWNVLLASRFFVYGVLCLMPYFLDRREERLWAASQSKI